MLRIANMTAQKVLGVLSGPAGLSNSMAELAAEAGLELPRMAADQIVAHNVAAELAERAAATKYPMVYVYCTKLTNRLREKFRTFSGDAEMVVEVRVSSDRLEEVGPSLHAYVDAVIDVVDGSRGDWGDGVVYCGGYDVVFGAIKSGGRNFLQTAKVGLVVEISAD
jgi:hypothetical protein